MDPPARHIPAKQHALLAELTAATLFLVALFLVTLRAYEDQAAPGMTVWEPKQPGEIANSKVSPSAQARREAAANKPEANQAAAVE